MRTITVAGEVYTLGDDCRWTGPEPLVDLLSAQAEIALVGTGPQDGFPVGIIFYHAVQVFEPTEYVDDLPFGPTPDDLVY